MYINRDIQIRRLLNITPDTVDAFAQLIPQLTTGGMLPTIEHLKNMVESNACFLFVAEEDEQIIGSITLATYRIPSGTKAWIEDVVVDGSQRGRGIGAMLVEFVIDFAKKQNIHSLDLTSGPSRVAANKLYQKLGFKRRETNVYRLAQ